MDDDNVRAVVLTGSVARGDHDQLSDVDVELYVHDPADLLTRRDWYQRFGDGAAVGAAWHAPRRGDVHTVARWRSVRAPPERGTPVLGPKVGGISELVAV